MTPAKGEVREACQQAIRRFNVDMFITIHVCRTEKDFEGWKVDRKLEFLDEFQHIINETLESGVSAFIGAMTINTTAT